MATTREGDMVESSQSYERTIEAAGAALARGDAASAEQAEALYREALATGEKALGPYEISLVPALTGLGAALILRGRVDEAQPVLTRAVNISEQQLGAGDPDFVILLNDLSRLYLKHAAHQQAEPLLQRLLEIKRAKGEDHPEVATVLAGLATVKQALGRYDEAEQLSRGVLDIRERTLAPNHIATIAGVEQLGHACAARGKVREALQSFERALAMREQTLGAQHPSLRTLRERIADLQLQASDDAFDTGEMAVVTTTRPRLSIAPIPVLEREPAAPRLVVPQQTALTVASPQPVPAPVPAAAPAPVPAQTNPAAYLNVLMDIKDELEEPQEQPAPQGKFAAILAGIGTAFRERRLVAVSAVAVVALPLIGLGVASAMKGNRGGWVTQTSYAQGLPARDSVAPTIPPADAARLAPIAVIPDVTKDSSSARHGASTATKGRTEPAPARRTEEPVIQLADIPRTPVGRLDSVVRAINVPTTRVGQSFQVQMQASLEDAQRASVAELRSNIPARSTKLIGAPPVPTYPYALARSGIGGEVRVRFEVDTLGRPVMGTFTVIRSPHARFSESVKKVIPDMRFEPARGPGPSARTISEMVEMTFTFAPQPSGP